MSKPSMSSGKPARDVKEPILEPLSETLLGARAYRALWNGIVGGRIESGAQLRPDTIAEQLDISTTPVREALHRMEGDGLVVKLPYRGLVRARVHRAGSAGAVRNARRPGMLQRQARVRTDHTRTS